MQTTTNPLPPHVPDRHLDEQVRQLDLAAHAAELLREARGGHTARTLARQGPLRVVLIALAKGARIPEHRAAAPITVQALFGKVRFTVADRTAVLSAGRALVVAGGLVHDLEAEEDSAVLLTLGGAS